MKRIIKLNQGTSKKEYRFTCHSDSQHEWLAVPRKLLTELNLLDKITRCSYQKGKTVYLEGDLDAGVLINELDRLNYSYKIVSGAWKNYSNIRNYDHYSGITNE